MTDVFIVALLFWQQPKQILCVYKDRKVLLVISLSKIYHVVSEHKMAISSSLEALSVLCLSPIQCSRISFLPLTPKGLSRSTSPNTQFFWSPCAPRIIVNPAMMSEEKAFHTIARSAKASASTLLAKRTQDERKARSPFKRTPISFPYVQSKGWGLLTAGNIRAF